MPGVLLIVLSALTVALACGFGPALIRRLPEPTGDPAAGVEVKTSYVELAGRPGLTVKLAAAGAAAGAVVAYALGPDPVLGGWLYLAALGVVLAYVDVQTRLLPTRLIAPSYLVLAAALGLAALATGDAWPFVRALLGWLAMGGFYFGLWFVYPKGLGYGDVRLSGLLGAALAYVGWGQLLTGTYAGFLLGGVGGGLLALLGVVDRRHYPFGPFMLLGAVVGLLWGGTAVGWYTGE